LLFGSNRLAALEELSVAHLGMIGDAASLARVAGLPSLRKLTMESSFIMDEGLQAFLRSPMFPALERLGLKLAAPMKERNVERLRARFGDGLTCSAPATKPATKKAATKKAATKKAATKKTAKKRPGR